MYGNRVFSFVYNLPDDCIATVREVLIENNNKYLYRMEEIDWLWGENNITGLISHKKIDKPITSRFEIMDL